MQRLVAALGVSFTLIGWLSLTSAQAKDGLYVTFTGLGGFSEVRDTENAGSLGGDTTNSSESDLVGGVGAALGYQWPVPWGRLRAEAEFHYRFRFDFDENRPVIDNALPNAGLDSNLASATWLANLNYMLDLDSDISPYIGGGLGATYYDAENEFNDIGGLGLSRDDTSGTNFTWAVNAGLLWDITEDIHFILGYRYIDLGEIDFGSFAGGGINVEGDYVSHDLLLTLGYRF